MVSVYSIPSSRFPFSRRPPPPPFHSPKPYSSSFIPPKPTILFSTRSYSSSQNLPPPQKTIHSSLKPVVVTLVAVSAAAAALLSGRITNHPPCSSSLTHAATSAVVRDTKEQEVVEQDEEEKKAADDSVTKQIESLQAQMEAKIKAGKLPEAIAVMDKIILLQPNDKDLLLLKAHLYTHDGNHDAAKVVFEEVLKKDPITVEAYHGLVLIASQTEEEEETEVAEGEGELDRIMERIGVAVETCKKENRKQELRDFMLLIAQVWVVEGEYDEALGMYRELVSEDPRDFRPYLCQGIIYTLLRKKDEAEKQFEKYRRLVPKGHPYAQYFEENMAMLKAFGQNQDNKRTGVLKS